MSPHYVSLISGYTIMLGLWFLINQLFPAIWDEKKMVDFKTPYLEFIYSIAAVITILVIGQLYNRNLLIHDNGNVFLNAINQFIIFSPAIALILIRKQSLDTIWIPKSRIVIRLLIGLFLAFCSILIYWLTRTEANEFGKILSGIYHYQNISYAVQIFMEDVTIALIFVRLSAWIGKKWSIIIVAILFSAGHIPTMLYNGIELIGLSTLFIDAFLGVLVLLALSKSKDIWWFFMVHFAMDMTQFYGS